MIIDLFIGIIVILLTPVLIIFAIFCAIPVAIFLGICGIGELVTKMLTEDERDER